MKHITLFPARHNNTSCGALQYELCPATFFVNEQFLPCRKSLFYFSLYIYILYIKRARAILEVGTTSKLCARFPYKKDNNMRVRAIYISNL